MITVTAEKTADGWLLQTADEFKDTLAGPFADLAEVRQAATELELQLLEPVTARKRRPRAGTVGSVEPLTLFRINDNWYRLVNHLPERKSIVEVVGEKRNESIPSNTEITEISVLSLR